MKRVLALGPLLLAACGGGSSASRIVVSSSAFGAGKPIPALYTCDGRDISPPLHWSGVPGDATQLNLTMTDPNAPGGNFIHWQLSGLSPGSSGLAAGAQPAVGNQGTNGFGTTGYRGPCPPRGASAHHYVITVVALANGQASAFGTLTGTYARR
jgi:hypothetical protein